MEYEVRAGLYDKEDRPDWTDDTFDAYNQKLKLVKQGNDVDWLGHSRRELWSWITNILLLRKVVTSRFVML